MDIIQYEWSIYCCKQASMIIGWLPSITLSVANSGLVEKIQPQAEIGYDWQTDRLWWDSNPQPLNYISHRWLEVQCAIHCATEPGSCYTRNGLEVTFYFHFVAAIYILRSGANWGLVDKIRRQVKIGCRHANSLMLAWLEPTKFALHHTQMSIAKQSQALLKSSMWL